MAFKNKLQEYLALLGKSDQKVVAVFGSDPEHCARAVRYLARECPGLPIYLFSTSSPLPETAALCARVLVIRDTVELLVEAQKALWPSSVALAVVSWAREPAGWLLKLGVFAIPPFRVLVMNEHEGFFTPTPVAVRGHLERRLHDEVTSWWPRWRDYNRAIRFRVVVTAAVHLPAFARWLFRRHRPVGEMTLPVVAARGSRIAEFRYEMKNWDRAGLLELVADPGIRYILFLQGDARAEVSDLLPLFEDPRTFAVARQSERRDRQKMMLVRAPFRSLQPGTAARTLAPVSRAMLVDRAKLAELKVPDTLVACAAWFLMFWKAAVGGWRSYTVGSTARKVVCPDWPYEEGEFIVRLLFDSKLREKAPRELDLARGNIRFRVAGSKPLREGRPRVLVVSPYLPYPLSHGGAVRIYNLCLALAGDVDLLLACFKEVGDVPDFDKLHQVFREVYVVDLDEAGVRDESLPEQVRLHPSASMRALIGELAASRSLDLIQVEYTHMAAFGDAAPGTPAILVEHDLTFSLYQQLARQQGTQAARDESERWLKFESAALARYDAVWVMSDEDRARALEHGARVDRTFVIPNGVDVERFVPTEEPAGALEVLYVGSFRHLPNILGFERLWREVMPRVWRSFPDAKLRVVAGPHPKRYWRDLRKQEYPDGLDPRIEIHGFVEDLRPLYDRATVVAVPLLVSAGTNVKVMEAMACRRAIVTTTVGCYGLGLQDGVELLIRDSSEGFAEAIETLLGDAALRRKLAENGRRTVEERFDWRSVAEQARASYVATMVPLFRVRGDAGSQGRQRQQETRVGHQVEHQ